MTDTGESAPCCPPGDGHGAWPATPRRKGPAPRAHTPGVHGRWEGRFETLAACGLCVHRPHSVVTDEGWSRGGAAHGREPPARGRAPGGPAGVAEGVAAHDGCAAPLGGLESAEGLGTGRRERTHGVSFHRGDLDHGELTRAGPPGPVHGVPAGRCGAVAGLVGTQRRRHDPASRAFVRQLPGAPVAPGARFLDNDAGGGRRGPRSAAVSAGARAGAHGAPGGHLSAGLWGDVRHRPRSLVDIHADGQRARLGQG